MLNYLSVQDLPALTNLREEAQRLQKNPFLHALVGKYQTLGLISFGQDLYTRLSLQKAAHHLGLHLVYIDLKRRGQKLLVGQQGTSYKTEGLKEFAQTIGAYADILSLYCPTTWQSENSEIGEELLANLQEYTNTPLINIETPKQRPLEALSNWLTLEKYKRKENIKVAIVWVPHSQALSPAVANSTISLLKQIPEVSLSVAHPPNYRLHDTFLAGIKSHYQQETALEGADFVIALNWASTKNYGKIENKDLAWQLTDAKMQNTQQAHLLHCQPSLTKLGLEEGLLQMPYSLLVAQAQNGVIAAQLILKEILIGGRFK